MGRLGFLWLMFAAVFFVAHPVLCAEVTIIQNQGISFGRILSSTGQTCVMDALTGSLTGSACYDMFGTSGVFLINGDPNRMVDMEVIPGVVSNNLTFTPRFDGGGLVRAVSLGAGGSALVNIGGTLATDPVVEPVSGAANLTYTLRVNYQ